jgi:hypothetical protein
MTSKLLYDLDPLDLEILKRAFDGVWTAVKEKTTPIELDSDEELEAVLRRELIEIACFNGVSAPETLRDILVSDLSHRGRSSIEVQHAGNEQPNEQLGCPFRKLYPRVAMVKSA